MTDRTDPPVDLTPEEVAARLAERQAKYDAGVAAFPSQWDCGHDDRRRYIHYGIVRELCDSCKKHPETVFPTDEDCGHANRRGVVHPNGAIKQLCLKCGDESLAAWPESRILINTVAGVDLPTSQTNTVS